MKALVKIKPREKVPIATGFIVSFISGIMNGFANIGGPPLVLWILAHNWSKDRLRSFVPTFIIMLLPIQFIFMLTAFGSRIFTGFLNAALYVPVILLAFWLGNITSGKLSVKRVRFIITLLLLITGLVYITMPLTRKLFFSNNQTHHIEK